jgi:hypothetical protein
VSENIESGEKAFCEVSIRFEIDGRIVKYKTSEKYVQRPGLADKGWCFGSLILGLARTLEEYLPPDEWNSLCLSLAELQYEPEVSDGFGDGSGGAT